MNKTQDSIALQLSISQQRYQNWESLTSNSGSPDYEQLLELTRILGISFEDLMTKDFENAHLIEKHTTTKDTNNAHLNALPNAHPNEKVQASEQVNDYKVLSEPESIYFTLMNLPEPNVFDLDSKVAAGIPALLSEKDKRNNFPRLYLPGLGPGVHIRAQIAGDSMHPTIKDMSAVVATQVVEPATGLREGDIYLMLDKDDGIVCKRLYWAGDDEIELVSDNDTHKPYKRHLSDVQALFKVQQVHSTDLRNYAYENRQEHLRIWNAIEQLQRKLPE